MHGHTPIHMLAGGQVAAHARTYARTHARAHTYARTHTRMHSRTHAHKRVRIRAEALTHAHTQAHTHALTQWRTHSSLLTSNRWSMVSVITSPVSKMALESPTAATVTTHPDTTTTVAVVPDLSPAAQEDGRGDGGSGGRRDGGTERPRTIC